jgi:hypothetical protein
MPVMVYLHATDRMSCRDHRAAQGDVMALRWTRSIVVRPAAEDGCGGVPVEDLRYKMIMALNAADIGNPICEQAAEICAEIAEQHCAQLHVTTTAQVVAAGQRAGNGPAPARA